MIFIEPEILAEAGFTLHIGDAVRPVMLQDKQFPDFPGVVGASTLLTWAGRYFIACTRHQLEIPVGSENFADEGSSPLFINQTGRLDNIPVSRMLFATGQVDEEYNDILIFEIHEEQTEKIQKEKFFPLVHPSKAARIHSCAVGCPSEFRELTYDPLDVKFVTQLIVCKKDDEFVSQAKFLSRYTYEPSAQNVDGFSGGAIFSLVQADEEVRQEFEGIIVRGKAGQLYVITAGFLFGLISRS